MRGERKAHGVVSVFQKLGAVSFLQKLLLSKCPEEQQPQLQRVFDGAASHPVGFIFNCRMVNVPPQIAAPLHQGLVDDIDWASKNEVGLALTVHAVPVSLSPPSVPDL